MHPMKLLNLFVQRLPHETEKLHDQVLCRQWATSCQLE